MKSAREKGQKLAQASEAEIWRLLESGKVLCRMIGGKPVVYGSESDCPTIPEQQSPALISTKESDPTAQLLENINKKLDKLAGGSREQDPNPLQEELLSKNEEIRKLRQDLEDLTTLNKTLEWQLHPDTPKTDPASH